MRSLITAAGLGTRFLPASKAVPKELLPVLDKPTIQYVVEEAIAAGSAEAVIITSQAKPAIRQHFADDEQLASLLDSDGKHELAQAVRAAAQLPVSFVDQDSPRGLGHAVLCGLEALPEPLGPFYLLLGDLLVPGNGILPRLKAVSDAHGGASVIAVLPVPYDQVKRFGVIAGHDLAGQGEPGVWQVTGLVEKPQSDPPSNLSIVGRYLLTPGIGAALAATPPGVGGEVQLTDAMARLLADEQIYALVIGEDESYDVGTVEGWLETNLRMAAGDPRYQGIALDA